MSPEPSVHQRECDVTVNTEAKEIRRPPGAEDSTHMCRQVGLHLGITPVIQSTFAICAVAVCMSPAQGYTGGGGKQV